MRKLCVLIGLLGLITLVTSPAWALEIRVAPSTFVLSSGGGKLTVHTDIAFGAAQNVVLAVNGVNTPAATFADNLGNLVAQCTKDAAAAAIGEFEGKTTTATVTLTVNGESASEVITVKR